MKRLLIAFFVLNLLFCSNAQDYHQWSEHFGARASFLGGAATAGLGDNATAYYNGAAMSFVDHPSFSISVNAYRISKIELKNILGKGFHLKETQLSTMPNLISGIYCPKKYEKIRLGYAIITRRNFSSKYDYLFQGYREVVSATNGPESFVAGYNHNHNLQEYWAGISIAYKVSKHFSIGLSHFGIYRNVKYSHSNEFSALPTDGSTGDVTSFNSKVSFNYWNLKGVLKPSIALDLENFKFGLTFTTPSFNMLGKADVYRDFSITNMDELITTDLKIVDRAEKLKTQHKENGSLAFGVSWKLGRKAWLHWTNETFFGGKYYLIFDSDQIASTYPTNLTDESVNKFFGDQNFLAFGEETVSRTNIGMGLEANITKKWGLYMGVRTDFMYNENPYFDDERIGLDSSKWNLYHASLGVAFSGEKMKKYSAGIEFAFTPKTAFYHVIDFNSPSTYNLFIGNGSYDATAKVMSFKFILEVDILAPKTN
jgi:hypothetical protein